MILQSKSRKEMGDPSRHQCSLLLFFRVSGRSLNQQRVERLLYFTVNISATETVPSSSFILQLSLRFAGNETHKLSCANRLELWRRHVTAITSALISYTELVTHASRLSPQSQAVLCTRILKYFHCVQLYNNTSHLYPGACPKRGAMSDPSPTLKMWLN